MLMRGDGHPLPTLVTAVDDATMRITHVIRDDALLPFTPRQIAVYRAMGLPEDQFPAFAHLPRILGADQQTLTRHNGVTAIEVYRREGYVPEALVNYVALLVWSPGEGREELGLAELVGGFDLTGLRTDPVQFDPAADRLTPAELATLRALSRQLSAICRGLPLSRSKAALAGLSERQRGELVDLFNS